MIARGPSGAAALLAVVLGATLPTGCAFAVEHPAVSAGVVGGTLALGTCKLASDNLGACFAVSGGAGAFLALVAATAIWLGGEGHSVAVEEQAQPLPAEDRPRERPAPSTDPAASAPGRTIPTTPAQPTTPTSPPATSAPPTSPPPTSTPPTRPPATSTPPTTAPHTMP